MKKRMGRRALRKKRTMKVASGTTFRLGMMLSELRYIMTECRQPHYESPNLSTLQRHYESPNLSQPYSGNMGHLISEPYSSTMSNLTSKCYSSSV